MNWRAFEAAAPEIAARVRDRFEATKVALLGTIRPDGSPRISPIGPYILGDDLVFGIMRSAKDADLEGEPRCVLHTAVSDGEGADGEWKLYGRALSTADPDLVSAAGAWWVGVPTGRYRLYRLDITEAAGVTWGAGEGRMQVMSWAPGGAVRVRERPYP